MRKQKKSGTRLIRATAAKIGIAEAVATVEEGFGACPIVVGMVASTAALLALLGGLAAVPTGLGLHHLPLDAINNASGNESPAASFGVFNPVSLLVIPLGALVWRSLPRSRPAPGRLASP